MQNKNQVEQFINLNKKSLPELRAIAEGLDLKTEGSRADLIDLLLLEHPQKSVIQDQAIPLRIIDYSGIEIPGARETYQKWRKLLFNTRGNRKLFNLLNTSGSKYSANLKYIKCGEKTLKHILQNIWYVPVKNQLDVISSLKQHPDKFEINIIQKHNTNGNSFLMLHVAPLKTA